MTLTPEQLADINRRRKCGETIAEVEWGQVFDLAILRAEFERKFPTYREIARQATAEEISQAEHDGYADFLSDPEP